GPAPRPRDRVVLAVLRGGAIATLLFCLFRPTLLVSAAVPRRNFLAVLLDDSRSMQVADWEGRPRAEFVRRRFAADSALLRDLSERFLVRVYRFSGDADRVNGAAELGFAGTRTSLATALERARQDLAAVPLAGMVVVTDGADNALVGGASAAAPEARGSAAGGAASALGEEVLSLRARGVPVYAVGVGSPAFSRDVELARVEAPRTVLAGSALAVDLTLRQSGYGGQTVPLVVEDGGRIVARQDVALPAGAEAMPVRVHVTLNEAGPRVLKFRVAPRDGEQVTENNEREALVVVRGGREKVLYVEGEVRAGIGFLRHAVAGDENLQLVTLVRTAENKFLRLGVDDSLELADGFPRTREELFKYRAIMLGSVDASFFTADQIRMLADFVSERGGGLLMVGGRSAFGEGGWAETPLAEVLPLTFDASKDTTYLATLGAAPTPAGAAHPATQIAGDEKASLARWRTLPALTAVNRISGTRPGATVLLAGEPRGEGTVRQPVLAFQRYGRGRAAAMPVQDSWAWQMDAEIPVEDQTYETFWRQLLRWLVSGVPGPVTLAASGDQVGPGDRVGLQALVENERFVAVNDARAVARVTSPAGATTELPLEWGVDRDGEYRGGWSPSEDGVHRVVVEAARAGGALGTDTAYVQRAPSRAEMFGATMREGLLKRVAEETGGRYYTPATVDALPRDVGYTKSGATVVERKDLWDMPVLFIVMLGFLGAEWLYRRARGLE
ncbi:MAG: glutamine amidotransferase, partial [Gemmatimonadaceae bacterium]